MQHELLLQAVIYLLAAVVAVPLARVARRAALRFRSHNLRSLHAAYPYYKDREQYVFRAREDGGA